MQFEGLPTFGRFHTSARTSRCWRLNQAVSVILSGVVLAGTDFAYWDPAPALCFTRKSVISCCDGRVEAGVFAEMLVQSAHQLAPGAFRQQARMV